MKKNLLSLSIAAAVGGLTLAGAAQAAVVIPGSGAAFDGATVMTKTNATALNVNPGGIGHILVVPYFSANNGNSTLLSITNTDTSNGKIVKVRFRSALNSDDIFDFQLFLSPGDVWTGSVSQSGATGRAFMNTSDSSCTLPKSVNGDFISDRLPAASATVTADTISALTREGYIEILNTADVPKSAADTTTTKTLYNTIKHGSGGSAPACDQTVFGTLVATDPASEKEAAGRGMDTPSGGLYATSAIVNVANAYVAWPTETTAVSAVVAANDHTAAHANLVFSPQTSDTFVPGAALSSTALDVYTADPLILNGTVTPKQFDFPDLSTTYVTAPGGGDATAAQATPGTATTQANTLSASLAVSSVANDYTTNPAISSKTDLNLTFPTRRYGVAVDYTASAATTGAPLVFNGKNAYFTAANTTLGASTGAGRYYACVATGAAVNTSPLIGFDRNEQGVTQTGFVISPGGSPANLRFCAEATVATVNNTTGNGVLSNLTAPLNISTGYTDGWIRLLTPGLGGTAGLPIVGSTYVFAKGPVATGLSTNFGYTVKNKAVFVSVTQ